MSNYKSEYERYEEAKKQVKEIKGFYRHLLVYILCIGFMIYINLRFSPQYLWFLWSAFGWGIGLLFHGLAAFKVVPFFGKDWEKRKIDELMDKDQKNKWE
ncbi:2TM domain-containing protein [Flavobacterium sp. U410]